MFTILILFTRPMHERETKKSKMNDGKNQECDKYQKPKKSKFEREKERLCHFGTDD